MLNKFFGLKKHVLINWIQFGDNNTKYFQTLANKRRSNRIWKIKDNKGLRLESHHLIAKEFVDEFTNRFRSSNNQANQDTWNSIFLILITCCITNEETLALTAPDI